MKKLVASIILGAAFIIGHAAGIGSQGLGESIGPDLDYAEPVHRFELGLILIFSYGICWWAAFTEKLEFRKNTFWQFILLLVAPALLGLILVFVFLK